MIRIHSATSAAGTTRRHMGRPTRHTNRRSLLRLGQVGPVNEHDMPTAVAMIMALQAPSISSARHAVAAIAVARIFSTYTLGTQAIVPTSANDNNNNSIRTKNHCRRGLCQIPQRLCLVPEPRSF